MENMKNIKNTRFSLTLYLIFCLVFCLMASFLCAGCGGGGGNNNTGSNTGNPNGTRSVLPITVGTPTGGWSVQDIKKNNTIFGRQNIGVIVVQTGLFDNIDQVNAPLSDIVELFRKNNTVNILSQASRNFGTNSGFLGRITVTDNAGTVLHMVVASVFSSSKMGAYAIGFSDANNVAETQRALIEAMDGVQPSRNQHPYWHVEP
jgi:hypothetical protein